MPSICSRSCPRFVILLLLTLVPAVAAAQSTPEYRGLWVETFNTALGTRADIDKVIAAAVDSNANAIFAQVRRRGDSWYLDSLEPLTQVSGVGEPDASGTWTFDPLRYLIDQAHLRGIEVHAFVIVGSIYNGHPTITGLPTDPTHAFNTNFWNKATGALYPLGDRRQWATRSLPHSLSGTGFNGQRYGAEWYIDPGHPDAEAYTVDVLTHLVRQYDLDGLHLDRIRYPEAPIDRVTPALSTWGINVGYNATSVARFKARHGSAASYYTAADIGTDVNPGRPEGIIGAGDVGYPRTNDPLWNDWRREQVSNLVRRLYLNVTAVKPRIKVSAATICFWTGPAASGGWERTEAHYRVFQDWRAWMQEGILDIAAPMIYKREHASVEAPQYDDWLSFTKTLAATSGRHSMPGLGAYINAAEGTLRQARRALARAPFDTSAPAADGVIFYALGPTGDGPVGNTNIALAANPFSYPAPNLDTPRRPNGDFFAGLRTSADLAGTTLFEDPGFGALFPTTAPIPDMPWKTSPVLGHAMGIAETASGPLDGAFVTLQPLADPAAPAKVGRTDGGGFFGFVGLAPGAYAGRAELGATRLDICRFDVTPGLVTTATARVDTVAPVTAASVSGSQGQNGWHVGDAQVTLAATDDCAGVAFTEYSFDGGAIWQRYSAPVAIVAEGTTVVSYRSVDNAGNTETAGSVTLLIDKTDPAIALKSGTTEIWPPNGRMEVVTLTGSAADAGAGLAGLAYSVVDEYGAAIAIDPRALAGASAQWTDTVALEARREGSDIDGRLYRIVATATDLAGRSASATVQIVVLHDRR